jgi:acyl-CoA thioesterase FadM
MMTVRMEITYRQPVPVGTRLTIVGRPVRVGGRLARAVGEVRLPDGSVAVEAALTLVDVPKHMRAEGALDALGWKVYP